MYAVTDRKPTSVTLIPTRILNSTVKWLRLKKYQYDVTLCLYIMTPAEQFILSMFAFA